MLGKPKPHLTPFSPPLAALREFQWASGVTRKTEVTSLGPSPMAEHESTGKNAKGEFIPIRGSEDLA